MNPKRDPVRAHVERVGRLYTYGTMADRPIPEAAQDIYDEVIERCNQIAADALPTLPAGKCDTAVPDQIIGHAISRRVLSGRASPKDVRMFLLALLEIKHGAWEHWTDIEREIWICLSLMHDPRVGRLQTWKAKLIGGVGARVGRSRARSRAQAGIAAKRDLHVMMPVRLLDTKVVPHKQHKEKQK